MDRTGDGVRPETAGVNVAVEPRTRVKDGDGDPALLPFVHTRDQLVAAILDFLIGEDRQTLDALRAGLEAEIDRAGSDALFALLARLGVESDWDYSPPDPLARAIHRLLATRFVCADSIVAGREHLACVGSSPVVLLSNHLSYSDANIVEVLLHRAGLDLLATRLTALAGPKVFTSRQRRFSSFCFGTVKVPQSTEVSSGEAVLSPRDVARAARRAIEVARDRLLAGDALLLFAEGTRSRTGSMQPLLPAAARYLDVPSTLVLPIGIVGPETLFPVDGSGLTPSRIVLHAGAPLRADALLAQAGGDRRVMMDALGLAIAELLPPSYRGVYGDPASLPDARAALARLRTVGA